MRIAFIIAVLVFGQSLSAKEVKIDLIPKTRHFPAAQVELKPTSSIHIDSVQHNSGVKDIALGTLEVLGGSAAFAGGATLVGAGFIVHLFRSDDVQEYVLFYSVGAVAMTTGYFLVNDGLKRLGLKRTSHNSGQYIFRNP